MKRWTQFSLINVFSKGKAWKHLYGPWTDFHFFFSQLYPHPEASVPAAPRSHTTMNAIGGSKLLIHGGRTRESPYWLADMYLVHFAEYPAYMRWPPVYQQRRTRDTLTGWRICTWYILQSIQRMCIYTHTPHLHTHTHTHTHTHLHTYTHTHYYVIYIIFVYITII